MSKILLVDDEPKVLRALSAALELDHDIYTAESGSDAKAAIEQNGPFDAILSDEVMPGISGHDFLNWCRHNTPKSKRIMLTGLPVTPELKAELHGLDEVSIFTKPWDVTEIEGVLHKSSPPAEVDDYAGNDDSKSDLDPKILILEKSERYRQFYSQVEEHSSAKIVFTDSPDALLKSAPRHDVLAQIVLDIDDDVDMGLGFVRAVCKQYPTTPVLVTTSPKLAKSFSSLESQVDLVTLLVKPFSYQRLVSHITVEIKHQA